MLGPVTSINHSSTPLPVSVAMAWALEGEVYYVGDEKVPTGWAKRRRRRCLVNVSVDYGPARPLVDADWALGTFQAEATLYPWTLTVQQAIALATLIRTGGLVPPFGGTVTSVEVICA